MNTQTFETQKEKWKNLLVKPLKNILKNLYPNLSIETDALVFIEELLIKLMLLVLEKNPHSPQDLERIINSDLPAPISVYAIRKAESALKECYGSSKLDGNHDSNSSHSNSVHPHTHSTSTSSLVKIVSLVPSLSSLNSNHSTINLSNCSLVICPIVKQVQQICKLDQQTSIYLCALLEYLSEDILKLVCKYVENMGNTVIKHQDARIALHADNLFIELFYGKAESPNCDLDFLKFDELSFDESEPKQPDDENADSKYEEIVKELSREERFFLRDLSLIIKVFREPFIRLLNSNSVPNTPTTNDQHHFSTDPSHSITNGTITEDDIDKIFSNIIDIYEFSIDFLSLIEDTIEMSEKKEGIGFCFEELMEGGEFNVFIEFLKDIYPMCIDYDEEDKPDEKQPHSHLIELLENQKVASCLRSVGQGVLLCIKYVLPKLLNSIVVHCAHYLKYIHLLKNTSTNEEECDSLEQSESSLSTLKTVLDKIIKSKNFKINEGYLKLTKIHGGKQFKSLKNKLDDMSRKIEGFNVTQHSKFCTEFIYEGILSKARKNDKKGLKKVEEHYCFLFDGLLFCCKLLNVCNNNNYEFKFHKTYPIRNFEVLDSNYDSKSFEIHLKNEQKQIIFLAKTKEEKTIWISNLLLLSQKPILERTLDSILSEEERRIPLKLPDPKQYRFAEKDSASNIIFDSSTGKDIIKAATLTKLIERLTYHQFADPKFLKIFLTTYLSFCSPEDLLDLLIERFNIPFKDQDQMSAEEIRNYSREELKRFKKDYLIPIQLRVLNVIKHWVESHYSDLDERLRTRLKEFLELHKEEKHTKKWVVSLINRIQMKEKDSSEKKKRKYLCENLPPIMTHIEKDYGINLITIHPVEFCRQLTLYEFDLYCAVTPFELMNSNKWTKEERKEKAPNLTKIIQHNTNLSFWLEKELVECPNLEERQAIYLRLVEMLLVLEELNNFNGLFEFSSALDRASVYRLEQTFSNLPAKYNKKIHEIRELREQHFVRYLESLRKINPPCVPFLGAFMTQLIHLDTGNPDLVDPEQKLINFSKRRKIAEITSEIQQYQNQPYCLQVYPELREFIEKLDPQEGRTEKEFDDYTYSKSLEIEPKNCKQLPKGEKRYNYSLKSPGNKSANLLTPHITSSFTNTFLSNHQYQTSSSSTISIPANNSSTQTHSNPTTPIFNNTPSNSTPTSPKLVQQPSSQQTIIQNLNHSPPKSPKTLYNYNNNTVFPNLLVGNSHSYSSQLVSNHSIHPINLPNSISMPHQLPNNNLIDSDIPPQIPPRTPRNRTSLSSIHQRTNSESSNTTSPNIQSQYNSAFNTPLTGKQSTDDVFTFNQASFSSGNNPPINVLPLPPKGASHTYNNSCNLVPPKLPPRRKTSDRT